MMKRIIVVLLLAIPFISYSQAKKDFDKHFLGLSHSFIDHNVNILDRELSKFDSSLSHIVRLSYQNELNRFWAFTVGLNNGFFNSVVFENQWTNRTYAVGLDYQIILKLTRESTLITPFVTFGNRLDHHIIRDNKNAWWLNNIYGAGLNLKATNHLKLQYQLSLDQLMTNDFNTALQHRLGILVNLKPRKEIIEKESFFVDSDGDGIPDSEDLCPEIAGYEQFRGCPDTVVVISLNDLTSMEDEIQRLEVELILIKHDNIKPKLTEDEIVKDVITKPKLEDKDGDGIPDIEDLCPETFGLKEFKGCPESVTIISSKNLQSLEEKVNRLEMELTVAKNENKKPKLEDKDGDGIPDIEDLCPETFGLKEFKGCPDSVTIISSKNLQSLEEEVNRLKMELAHRKNENIKSKLTEDTTINKVATENDKINIVKEKAEKSDKLGDAVLQEDEYYFIITMSALNFSVAENWRKKHKNQFPDARIIPTTNGFYRVGIYAGRDREYAGQLLEQVKEKGFASWISIENYSE